MVVMEFTTTVVGRLALFLEGSYPFVMVVLLITTLTNVQRLLSSAKFLNLHKII